MVGAHICVRSHENVGDEVEESCYSHQKVIVFGGQDGSRQVPHEEERHPCGGLQPETFVFEEANGEPSGAEASDEKDADEEVAPRSRGAARAEDDLTI
jgi:hypothetical protein